MEVERDEEQLENLVYDAGGAFSIMKVEEESEDPGEVLYHWEVLVIREDGIKMEEDQHIYLVDHAWTYRVRQARTQLLHHPGLLPRMAMLMDLKTEDKDRDSLVAEVLEEMWKYSQTYQIGNVAKSEDEDYEPIWYILDEFGSKIQHNDEPSCRLAPFYYVPAQLAFSVLWPLTDLGYHDEVTRDYAENVNDPAVRRARLLPWIPDDLTDVNFEQEEFDEEYFKGFCQGETLPDPDVLPAQIPNGRKIKVWSDIGQVQDFLTDDRFQIVTDQDDADIWWPKEGFKDFRKFSKENHGKFINQFPCESLLTVKDPLAVVARRADAVDEATSCTQHQGKGPPWLPVTYNLHRELPQFVSYFQHREASELDNHWICKPWNLARGMDMHITNNLNHIVRLPDTGPKVACKYVADPVLFHREEIGWVKFDIRYIVLLASARPLQLYAYRVFWLRFANKPYSLDHFDDYEKHYTVMNYQEGVQLKQIHYDEFIPMFERQYPNYSWQETESKIFAMFKELFGAAACRLPPSGIPACPQSRSMYAIDLLLQWNADDKGNRYMQPMLCELNFCPDCERACKYHPHFYNDVFSTLFLQDTDGRPVTRL